MAPRQIHKTRIFSLCVVRAYGTRGTHREGLDFSGTCCMEPKGVNPRENMYSRAYKRELKGFCDTTMIFQHHFLALSFHDAFTDVKKTACESALFDIGL